MISRSRFRDSNGQDREGSTWDRRRILVESGFLAEKWNFEFHSTSFRSTAASCVTLFSRGCLALFKWQAILTRQFWVTAQLVVRSSELCSNRCANVLSFFFFSSRFSLVSPSLSAPVKARPDFLPLFAIFRPFFNRFSACFRPLISRCLDATSGRPNYIASH